MIGEVPVFAIILIPLAFLFVIFCIYLLDLVAMKSFGISNLKDDGWKKVREEGKKNV